MQGSDDRFERLLTEQPQYLDDAGFTDRVVERLPRRPAFWRRRGFLLGAITALALFVGLVILPGGQAVFFVAGSLAKLGGLLLATAETTVSWNAILMKVVLFGALLGCALVVARPGSRA